MNSSKNLFYFLQEGWMIGMMDGYLNFPYQCSIPPFFHFSLLNFYIFQNLTANFST